MSVKTQNQESNPFPVGSHITMRLMDGSFLSLQIIKSFPTSAVSQIYLVCPPVASNLPSEIILKVLDPRYCKQRIQLHSSPPWTLEAETEATCYRQEVADGKHEPRFWDEILYDDDVKPYLFEELFYGFLKQRWEDSQNFKISARDRVIPKFHASGNIIPPANTRSIEPFALLIEYIGGRLIRNHHLKAEFSRYQTARWQHRTIPPSYNH